MLSWLLISSAFALPSVVARAALQERAPEGLVLEATPLKWAGGTIVRFSQTLDGLAVLGPGPRVSLDAQHRGQRGHGHMRKHRPLTLSPSISAEAAILRAHDGLFIDPSSAPWPGRARLAVHQGSEPRLAWEVNLARAHPFQTWEVHVDAVNGELLHAQLSSQTADGTVFPESPVYSEPTVVTLENLTAENRLLGTYAEAFSCMEWDIDPKPFGRRDCLAIEPTALPDHKGNYFYAPAYGALDDPFAEVHAYHHTDLISAWADERWGIRQDEPIRVLTNFPLTNAFYGDFDGDGTRDTSYGISDDGYNFAYDSDVVYHEYGHAIVRTIAGSMGMGADEIGIDWTSGALNEGTADIFAMVLNGDPLLAEYLGQSDRWDTAIRDLEPDRQCPEDLQSQVHRSGEILASLGWNLIEVLGQDMTAELLIGALGTWSNQTTWADAGRSLQDATEALHTAGAIDDSDKVEALATIHASGMPDCTRIIDLSQVQSSTQVLLNLGLDGDYARFPAGVQFSMVAPVEATAIELEILDFDGRQDGTGWTIYVRAGEPVGHTATKVEGIGLGFAAVRDFDLQVDGANLRVIRIDAESSLQLEPGEIYFFAIASRNLSRAPLDLDYAQIAVAGRTLMGREASSTEISEGGCSTISARPRLWLGFATLLIWGRTRRNLKNKTLNSRR